MSRALQVGSIRQVYNDGNHNAFTDLCRFAGKLYLTFRNCPEGHMLFTSSRIIVMRSEDGKQWEQVHSFSVPERDVRDPHFMELNGRLFVYSGTWLVDPADSRHTDMSEQLGYCAWSDDGSTWHGPRALAGTHGYYIWRAKSHNGVGYLNARCVADAAKPIDRAEEDRLMESWLMQSADGFSWTPQGLIQEINGDETAFVFEPDGGVVAVARSAGRRAAQLCRSRPPYREWTRHDLDRYIGGPLLARWGDRYLVGGRKMIGSAKPTTALYWLAGDALQEIAELPSGGDTSYPGFVEFDPDHGLLSYYSSHEGSGTSLAPSAIYLADLVLT